MSISSTDNISKSLKIGIIAAMDEELELLRKKVNILDKVENSGIIFYIAELGDISVIIVQSGIGKTQAAMATTLLYMHFNVDFIYNTGTAGGLLDDLSIGDVVIAENLTYFDVDVTAFGYKIGQLPKQPEFFNSSINLIQAAKLKASELGENNSYKAHFGKIVSGDSFVSNIERKNEICNNFEGVIALDMESAAIAQVCTHLKIPFLVIRSISDKASDSANSSFEDNIKLASENATNFLLNNIINNHVNKNVLLNNDLICNESLA